MRNLAIIPVILVFILAGCSSSRIISSWKEPDATAKSYKKVMVLSLIGDPERQFRQSMEQHMVGDLRALGYDAVCACEEYGPKAFEGMKENEAVEMLKKKGFDAVITIVLLSKAKEKYYQPGYVNYTPYEVYHRRFWGYYTTMHGRVYEPGYYSVSTKYFWETNLYDMEKANLVYSAQSQSFDPGSVNTTGHEYGLMIVKDMVKQNVLQDQKNLQPKQEAATAKPF